MATLIKRGKVWYAVYWEGKRPDRKKKWLRLDSKKAKADIKLGELAENIESKKFNRAPQNKTWELYCNEYLQYSKTNHSLDTYQRDQSTIRTFNRLIHLNLLSNLTPVILERYKEIRLAQKIASSTVNRELGTLKAMGRRGMEWGYIPYSELRVIKKLKEERKITQYFEDKQIKLMREKVNNDINGLVRIDLAVYTGFRRSEMLMVKWEDIDFEKDIIELKSKEGHRIKDYEERRIQLHPILKNTLIKWRRKCQSEYVLEDIHRSSLTHWWGRLLKSCNLTGTLHITRHTVGTHLVRTVGSDKAKDFLGHASVRTTERYSHQKSEVVPVNVLKY